MKKWSFELRRWGGNIKRHIESKNCVRYEVQSKSLVGEVLATLASCNGLKIGGYGGDGNGYTTILLSTVNNWWNVVVTHCNEGRIL